MRIRIKLKRFLLLSLVWALSVPVLAQTLPPEIARGRDWLRAQVQSDGSVAMPATALATTRQTRAETLETLARFNLVPVPLLDKVRTEATDRAVEHLARKLIALGKSNFSGTLISNAQNAAITELKSYQNADGGFGGASGYQSNALDTSFALLGFRATGTLGGTEVARAINFLASHLTNTAPSVLTANARALPYVDAYVLIALQTYAQHFPIAASVDVAKARLLANANQGLYLETLLNCTSVIAISLTGQGDPSVVSLRAAIRSAQAANGSWSDDPFLTALALRALTNFTPQAPPTLGLIAAVIRDAQTLAPLPGATLTLDPNPQFTATSGAGGGVQITDITPGSYAAIAEKAGYEARRLTGIQIVAGQSLDMGDIQLSRVNNAAVLRGLVTDVRDQSPIAGVSIAITGAVTGTVNTGPDGRYEYISATAGTITVQASKTGFQSATGTGTLVIGQTLIFSPALYADGVPTPTAATLIGKVVSTVADTAIAGATITFGARTAQTDADGRFALTEVATGAFSATIVKVGYQSAGLSGSLALGVNDAGLIRLSPVNTGVSSLAGKVTDAANGTVINNARISIAVQNLETSSDSAGMYRINSIQTVPFTAEVSAPGYGTRILTAGQTGHANFSGDVQLSRLTAGDLSLESVVMGAPEYQPYTEATLVGTVKNNGSTNAGLIFNAIVRDSQNRVIRDIPAVVTVFNSRPGDNIIAIPANASKPISIKWGLLADLADNYTVTFRGVTPEGQVLLEGPANYRVLNAKRIGGGIELDPPLLQAGLNQAVNITGQLSNVGNVDLNAGNAELTIKLLRGDSRPAVLQPPIAGAVIAAGAPMQRPTFLTRDADGNFYTVNYNTNQILRITPQGEQTVLATVPSSSGPPQNSALSTIVGIGVKAGALLIGRSNSWVTTMSLTAPYAFTHAPVPFVPTQTPNGTYASYYVDKLGNEYFASHSPNVIRKRNAAGVMSTLSEGVDSDYTDLDSCSNGKLYAASRTGNVIIEIDPVNGRSTALVRNARLTQSVACGNDNALYFSEVSAADNKTLVRKRAPDGTLSLLAGGFADTILDLRIDATGVVFALLNRSGEIWKIAANGSKTLWTRGLLSNVNALHYDNNGNLQLSNSGEVRRLKADGAIEDVGSGFSGLTDLLTLSDQRLLWLGNYALNQLSNGVSSVLAATPNNARVLTAVSQLNNGEVLVSGYENSGLVINRLSGNTLQTQLRHPGAGGKTSAMPNGQVLILQGGVLFTMQTNGNVLPLPVPKLGTVVTYIYEQWVAENGDIYLRDSGNRIYRYDPVTGALTLTHTVGEAINYGFVLDAQGRLIFSRGLTIIRFDPADNSKTQIAAMPGNTYALDLVITNAGQLYARGNDAKVHRVDVGGTSIVNAASSYTYELNLNAARDQPMWREGANLVTLTATGPGVPLVLAFAPDSFQALADGRLLTWRGRESEFTLASATGVIERKIPIAGIVARSVALDNTLYTLGGGYLHRYLGGNAIERVGQYVGADAIAVCDGKVWLNQSNGLYELGGDGVLVRKLASPAIQDGSWGVFACHAGKVTVQNRLTKGLLVFNSGALAESYAGFANANNLIERANGKWWVAGEAALFEVDADGKQARLVKAIAMQTLAKTTEGYFGVSQSSPFVKQISDQGDLIGYASQFPILSAGISMLAPMGSNLIAASSSGVLYKREGTLFKAFASGLGKVIRMAVSDSGDLWAAGDFSGGAVGKITPLGFEPVASNLGSICALEALGDGGAAVGFYGGFSLLDLAGRKTKVNAPNEFVCGILSGSTNSLIALTNTTAELKNYAVVAPLPPIAPGTIVHRETKPHLALPRNANANLPYTPWTPPFGGDFELEIKSTDASISGLLYSGLHVGALATAELTVSPGRVTPKKAQLHARTELEGGDFSTLSRINTAQIQQIFSGIYPTAMGLDATGAVWFTNGNNLSRAVAGVGNPQVFPIASTNRGQIPVDALGRAYVATYAYDATPPAGYRFRLYRVDASGASVVVAAGPGIVASLAMDANDVLYALNGQKILRISQAGLISDYATLPTTNAPFGLTIDGVGTLYAQMYANEIFQIDSNALVTKMLTDASFEYEGVNIAGTCSEGLLFTPVSLEAVGQSGEEYTIAQLLGQTGEIGPILNGRLISDDLTDLDFIVYDKFASNILIMTDLGAKMFKIPVTCGAIDVDYHLVLFVGQDATGITPTPTQILTRPDGSKELIWRMRDLNAQGINIQFDTELDDLIRGTDRPIARAAFMEFRNTFGGAPVRQTVSVPTVHVDDLIEIRAKTDLPVYPPSTPVLIDVKLRNIDEARKTGRLFVRIVDSSGTLVSSLIDRAEVFGPLEDRTLNPPFNSAQNRAGDYRLLAQILGDGDEVLAEDSAAFKITAGGSGQVLVSSTVATDRANYAPSDAVLITANVKNDSSNVSLTGASVQETVLRPDSSVLYTQSLPLGNLEPGASARLSFPVNLSQAPLGSYLVRQVVLSANGTTLSDPSTSFAVVSQGGNDALVASITAQPQIVQRGEPSAITASVTNRSNQALNGVPLVIRVIDPAQLSQSGAGVLASFPFVENLSANTPLTLNAIWATQGVPLNRSAGAGTPTGSDAIFAHGFETPPASALGDYIVVLVANLGGSERVLAQTSVRVVDIELSGTLGATPSSVFRGNPVTLSASASNGGNIAAVNLPFKLQVTRLDTSAVVREFNYSESIAVNEVLNKSEVLDTQVLTPGNYRATWTVRRGTTTQTLAQANFLVLQPQLAGTISVAPNIGVAGTPFTLSGLVRNLGNAPAKGQLMRIEVRRLDTQVLVQTWNETGDVLPTAQYPLVRVFDSTGASPGDYRATLAAYTDSAWQDFASTTLTVSLPATDVQHSLTLQRDARLLVLASCAPGQTLLFQSRTPSADRVQDQIEAATQCELQKKTFLESWLNNRGLVAKVVLTSGEFISEMRCGKYNVHWLAGGSAKLSIEQAKELREGIYRGEGLLVDSQDLQSNVLIDAVLGQNVLAQFANSDLSFTGAGTLFPAVSVASIGRALNISTQGAQVEARFDVGNSPAILSNNLGQGRSLGYAFDLVELLKRDGTQPAQARLFDNAITFVAPTVAAPDYAGGSYVAVTTVVQNRGLAIDLRVDAGVNAPALTSAIRPAASSVQSNAAFAWDFSLPIGATRSFDAGVQLPLANANSATTATAATSALSRRDGSTLTPLGSQQIALSQRDLALNTQQLIAALNAANLLGNEALARTRVITALNLAQTELQANQVLAALSRWLAAAQDIISITSTSNAVWRLSNARLLEIGQRRACGLRDDECNVFGDLSPYTSVTFESFTGAGSAVKGRIASGFNVQLTDYQVAESLGVGTLGSSLVVAGDLIFPSGRVHHGDIQVRGSIAGVGASVIAALNPNQQLLQTQVLPVNFAAQIQRLVPESGRLGALAANTTQTLGSTLALHGNDLEELQIFKLNAADLAGVNRITIDRVNAAASVLINVGGSSVSVNADMSSFSSFAGRVLLNFPQATSLTLGGTVNAAILAPRASTQGTTGTLNGNIVTGTWNGPMQINAVPYLACTRKPVSPVQPKAIGGGQ